MNNTTVDLSEIMLDFESFKADLVEIMPDQVHQALSLSQNTLDFYQQWQVYLNALGVFGLENWLEENSSDLTLNTQNCSLYQPEFNLSCEAVFQLQINQFNVCLLTVASLTDEIVSVPQMVLDLPEYMAHFYIVVEVQEELETARVLSFFSYQDWQQYQTAQLQPESDWTYSVPLSWMNFDTEKLLLQLRCLEAANIPLLPIPNRTSEITAVATELQQILPNLQSGNSTITPLWQQLTWEQARVVLTQPELLKWVSQIQTAERQNPSILSQLRHHLSDIFQLITQPSINISHWLSNQFDQIADELSWVFLPNLSLAPATAMRSSSESLTTLLQELQQDGVEVPAQMCGAYHDLQLNQTPLRLYTLTWSSNTAETNPEWTLLLILGTPNGTNLTPGIGLRVSDATEILDEQQLSGSSTPYLYTQVVGELHETFIVTVTTATGSEETLPPFTFNPC